jgi:hypothetical protein
MGETAGTVHITVFLDQPVMRRASGLLDCNTVMLPVRTEKRQASVAADRRSMTILTLRTPIAQGVDGLHDNGGVDGGGDGGSVGGVDGGSVASDGDDGDSGIDEDDGNDSDSDGDDGGVMRGRVARRDRNGDEGGGGEQQDEEQDCELLRRYIPDVNALFELEGTAVMLARACGLQGAESFCRSGGRPGMWAPRSRVILHTVCVLVTDGIVSTGGRAVSLLNRLLKRFVCQDAAGACLQVTTRQMKNAKNVVLKQNKDRLVGELTTVRFATTSQQKGGAGKGKEQMQVGSGKGKELMEPSPYFVGRATKGGVGGSGGATGGSCSGDSGGGGSRGERAGKGKEPMHSPDVVTLSSGSANRASNRKRARVDHSKTDPAGHKPPGDYVDLVTPSSQGGTNRKRPKSRVQSKNENTAEEKKGKQTMTEELILIEDDDDHPPSSTARMRAVSRISDAEIGSAAKEPMPYLAVARLRRGSDQVWEAVNRQDRAADKVYCQIQTACFNTKVNSELHRMGFREQHGQLLYSWFAERKVKNRPDLKRKFMAHVGFRTTVLRGALLTTYHLLSHARAQD